MAPDVSLNKSSTEGNQSARSEKHLNRETIILTPTLGQVYKGAYFLLKRNNKIHHIPLWEQQYISGRLSVFIQPCLPSFMSLQKNRDLHIWLSIKKPLEPICLNVIGKNLVLPCSSGPNKNGMRYVYKGCGVPCLKQPDILAHINRTDLVVHVSFK